MRNGTAAVHAVNATKRLWDAPDIDGLNQFSAIRTSHFTRAF
jgi:hypothetical protein